VNVATADELLTTTRSVRKSGALLVVPVGRLVREHDGRHPGLDEHR
jgi:hypothetical protein